MLYSEYMPALTILMIIMFVLSAICAMVVAVLDAPKLPETKRKKVGEDCHEHNPTSKR